MVACLLMLGPFMNFEIFLLRLKKREMGGQPTSHRDVEAERLEKFGSLHVEES